MRAIIAFACLNFLTAFCGYGQVKAVPEKHALIVAIGNYPEAGGWSTISGHKDVPFITRALNKQGFPDSNMTVLTDSMAAIQLIENALQGLTERVSKGDVVVIHFSSHGEQIEDDNGDESDGLDEAIVAYDAVAPSKSKDFNKDKGGYFRDDRFGYYTTRIRSKLGPSGDLVVFMDACHSGSGTRGSLKSRGGEPPLVSPGFKKPLPGKQDASGLFKEGEDHEGLASFVVFSAARAEELAYEVLNENNESMGSLTYAISKTFEQLEGQVSYRSIFSKIQSVLNSKVQGQHPVLEGTGIDRELFGGKYIKQKYYAEIEQFKSSNQMELNAGTFAGLNVGARVLLYPSGTTDPTGITPSDSGTVEAAWPYRSVIRTKKAYKGKPSQTWVFVSEPVYRMEHIVLNFQNKNKNSAYGFTRQEIEQIREQLKDMPLIRFEGLAELTLTRGPQIDSLILYNNGYFFAGIPRNNDYASSLRSRIEQYAQYRFLRDLSLSDSTLQVKVELIPIINEMPDTAAVASKIKGGIYTVAEGDEFTLRVTNLSDAPVYINVLDMQPDGWINPILPNREQNVYARDLQIPAGSVRLFSDYVIGIGPPYGMEVYKVFISKKVIDLENLVVFRDKSAFRGNFSVLENLAQTSMEATRGSNISVKTGNANGSVMDVVFEIVPGE